MQPAEQRTENGKGGKKGPDVSSAEWSNKKTRDVKKNMKSMAEGAECLRQRKSHHGLSSAGEGREMRGRLQHMPGACFLKHALMLFKGAFL
jgi:hypothetical protein